MAAPAKMTGTLAEAQLMKYTPKALEDQGGARLKWQRSLNVVQSHAATEALEYI